MAVFGFHVVLTLIAASVFSKVTSRFSICDWAIFKGLYYHLLEASLLPPAKPLQSKDLKRRKKNNVPQSSESNDRLLRIPLQSSALEGVPFFSTMIWTFNYFGCAIIVYGISEMFTVLFPLNQDRNTSLVWVTCALFLLIHVLLRLTAVKMYSEELHAERNVIICFSGVFFLVFMVFIMFGDTFMDMHFQRGYEIVTTSLNNYLATQGRPAIFAPESRQTPLLFLIILTVLFTVVGATFFFPCFQYASWYLDVVESCGSPLKRLLVHATFFLPLITFLLYTRPVKDHFLASTKISEPMFDASRLLLIGLWTALRLAVGKLHLQAFLDVPRRKALEMQQDSQLKAEDRQRKIAQYAAYFCAAALQYYVPVLITFTTTVLLKNMGEVNIISAFWPSAAANTPITRRYGADDADSAEALRILLAVDAQKPFWTLCVMMFLAVNSVLSVLGVLFRRVFLSPA